MEALDYELASYYDRTESIPEDYMSPRFEELLDSYNNAETTINNMKDWKGRLSHIRGVVEEANSKINAGIKLQTWLEKKMNEEKANY